MRAYKVSMIPLWISKRSGETLFTKRRILLEPRTITGHVARAAWKGPSAESDSSDFSTATY